MGEVPQFTIENIESVLHQLYHDAQSQAQADQFLILAQLSPEAWNFAWLLLDPSKPNEAQFFGARTLQTKITKQWNEVPIDQYENLRMKLFQAIFSYVNGPKVILTRLCIAMSSFVLQTITDFWPTAVTDLMSAFQAQNISNDPHQVAHVLLEMLSILCEEFHTINLPHVENRSIRSALQGFFQNVMSLIESVLSKSSTPVDLCEMALKCYSSWSQLGSDVFEYHTLLSLTFDAVYRDDLCYTALETLTNIATHPSAHKFCNVLMLMIENIAKFDNLLLEASQDMDMTCSIYAMIMSVLETHTAFILTAILNKPEKEAVIMKCVHFMLQCSCTPGQYPIDELCSVQAFGFWYSLQDSIVSSDPPIFEKLLLKFHPVFQLLLDAYITKLQFPQDSVYKQWNSDERESFRCYRQDIGDSMMFCYNILRHSALANLLSHLQIATNKAAVDPSQWQYLEACLFSFKEIAESVSVKEHCYIPQFMAHLPTVPLNHLKVISATMEAIGAYAEWINLHPDVLGFVVPLLLMGLQTAEIAQSASFALKDITRDCHNSLQPYAQQILVSAQEALNGNVIKPRERVRLMSTIGHVLSICPYTYIISYLNTLLAPMIESFEKIIMQDPTPGNKAQIVLQLHMLTMLFSTLDISPDRGKESDEPETCQEQNNDLPQPVFLILQKVLPLFSTLVVRWQPSEQITEALCDALKRSLSTLLDDSKPFIPDMVNMLLHTYKLYLHTSVLDMAKQIIILFANDESERAHLFPFFVEICNHTLQVTNLEFRENTCVLQNFLQLLTQVIKKAFIFFKNNSVNMPVLFQCSVAALGLPEKPTVRASSSFIAEFITHSREVPEMLDVVNSQGQTLVIQVLKIIGGDSPRPLVEYMPDILIALNKKYFDNLCRWMNSFSKHDNFLPSRVTQQQWDQFVKLVLKERTNRNKLKETVCEFSLLCRGLIGTEYAARTIS